MVCTADLLRFVFSSWSFMKSHSGGEWCFALSFKIAAFSDTEYLFDHSYL